MKPVFVGGSLSFKGDKKAKKKKKSKAKHSVKSSTTDSESISYAADAGGANDAPVDAADAVTPRVPAAHENLEADLTDAERKALTKRRERELQELQKIATKSHRERVEEFNEKLASLTEHNDIPRVRAACETRLPASWPSHLRAGSASFALAQRLSSRFFLFIRIQVSAAGNG
jgi:protein FAM32A